MRHVKTILSAALIFGAGHVQAESQNTVTGTPKAVDPVPEMQVAQSHDGASTQRKDAKVTTARSPSRSPSQNRTYEVPLGDYNNGGHFGD